MPTPPHSSSRSAYLAAVLGFGAILFEGYDLVVYGTAVPALLAYSPWALTPAKVGAIGSAALFGMFVGAPTAGWLSDRFGRRTVFIALLAFFSFMMILVALASTPLLLGLFRFIAGVGFGGIPPTAIALVNEVAPAKRKVLFAGGMLTGFGFGGVLAGALSVPLLAHAGFRGLFAVGAVPLFTLVPLAAWFLPESPSYRRDSPVDSEMVPVSNPLVGVLRGRLAKTTLLFTIANFFSLLVTYGLLTWLPQLMRGAGYAIGPALHFLLPLNLGAVGGALFCAWLSDRIGGRSVAVGMFLGAAILLEMLTIRWPAGVTTLLVLMAGAAVGGNQSVLFGFMATTYPDETRATAIGVASGIGRLGAAVGPLVCGLLLSEKVGLSGNFLVFVSAALIAGVAILFLPRIRMSSPN